MTRHLNTPSEYQEQCTVFRWASAMERKHPELKYLFSTLNGVKLPIGLAMKCKRSGMKKGVLDIWFPIRLGGANGLVVELKVKGNSLTAEQKDWIGAMQENGWIAKAAYGADEAIKIIEGYLCGKDFEDIDSMHCRRPQDDRHAKPKPKPIKDTLTCTNCRHKGLPLICAQCPSQGGK